MSATKKRETMKDVQAQRDEYRKQLHVTDAVMCALARGEVPDIEEKCTMPDGSTYHFRVFRVDGAHGGLVLISFSAPGNQTTYFDAHYFEDAMTQARNAAGAMPETWMYRDAFDRMNTLRMKNYQGVA